MNEIKIEKPKRTRKPKEDDIESLYGRFYPKDSEWNKFHGIEKPVHPDELHRFHEEYGQCCVGGLWKRMDDLRATSCNNLVSRNLTEGEEAEWIRDSDTNRYFHKDRGIVVIGRDMLTLVAIKKIISPENFKRSYFKCDWTGEIHHHLSRVDIKGSDRYKKVCADILNKIDPPFRPCIDCGDIFEAATMLANRRRGGFACRPCHIRRANDGIILPHNSKLYPAPVRLATTRMGYEIKDNMVVSTMKREDVYEERNYGVEVEVELFLEGALREEVDRFSIARALYELMGKDFILIKEDGTLIKNGKYSDKAHPYGPSYAGFEVVSAPAPLEVHKKKWSKLSEFKYLHLLRSWDEPTCGFHIHLSKDAVETDLSGGRMLAFMNAKPNRKFIWKVAGRSEVAFTKYVDRKISDYLRPEVVVNPDEVEPRNRSRRVALNLSNPATIEMRIFRGTINPRHIIRNLEFYDSLFEFCMPCTRRIHDMYDFRQYVRFVDGNRKRWPLLASWFALHDIIKLKKIKRPERANLDKLTIKLEDIPESELIKV